jgi:hypothetical protein
MPTWNGWSEAEAFAISQGFVVFLISIPLDVTVDVWLGKNSLRLVVISDSVRAVRKSLD